MNPLERLRAALEEYLAAGEDTPVAAEAQALMAAIEGAAPQGDMGAPPEAGLDQLGPPPAAGPPLPPEAGVPPVDEAMPPPQPEAKTFEGARAGAKDRLKKLNRKQGTKA